VIAVTLAAASANAIFAVVWNAIVASACNAFQEAPFEGRFFFIKDFPCKIDTP
jgi:hypothetical protein